MPRKRISIRKIREILRLLWDQHRSIREVAVTCGVAEAAGSFHAANALYWEIRKHIRIAFVAPAERAAVAGAARFHGVRVDRHDVEARVDEGVREQAGGGARPRRAQPDASRAGQ